MMMIIMMMTLFQEDKYSARMLKMGYSSTETEQNVQTRAV